MNARWGVEKQDFIYFFLPSQALNDLKSFYSIDILKTIIYSKLLFNVLHITVLQHSIKLDSLFYTMLSLTGCVYSFGCYTFVQVVLENFKFFIYKITCRKFHVFSSFYSALNS